MTLRICVDIKKVYGSFKKEILCKNFILFDMPLRIVTILVTCLLLIYSEVHKGKHL
jgi:hypothetical protein